MRGDGEFIGTVALSDAKTWTKKEDGTDREQRDDARKQYERVIRTIADSGALEGQDIGSTWKKFAIIGVNPKQAQEHPRTADPDIPPARD